MCLPAGRLSPKRERTYLLPSSGKKGRGMG